MKRHKAQVLNIGKVLNSGEINTLQGGEFEERLGIAWIEFEPETWALVMLKVSNTRFRGQNWSNTNFKFVRFIDDDMGDSALNYAKIKQHNGVQMLNLEKLKQARELNLLSNWPTKFPKGKRYGVTGNN